MKWQDNKLHCDWSGENSAFHFWLNPKTRLARVCRPPLYLLAVLGFASFPMPRTKGFVLNLPVQIGLVSKLEMCPFLSLVIQNIQRKTWPPVTRHGRSCPHLHCCCINTNPFTSKGIFALVHTQIMKSLAIKLSCSISSLIFTNR